MGFDRARLVQLWCTSPTIGAADSDSPLRADERGMFGSGYRVSSELVLTAAHVVPAAVAVDAAAVEVAALGGSRWVPAAVVWRDETADVAVLRVGAGLPTLPPGSPRPRWGQVDGDEPVGCTAVGFPWAAAHPDAARDTEQLFGFVPPLSGVVSAAQVISLLSSAPRDRSGSGSPWAGMSGAAVFAGRFLVGVVVIDPQRYGTDRLHAVPLAPLLTARPDLAALLNATTGAEPVRLPSRLALTPTDSVALRAPYRPLVGLDATRAPARLLLPEHGLVPFLGRQDQLAELERWCQQPGQLALRVLTGDGGAGKSRLAAQLCCRLAAAGWDTGFTDLSQPGGDTILDYDRPTLIVIDDADLSVTLIARVLARLTARLPAAPPVRLLLLARHRHLWWDQLNEQTDELADAHADPPVILSSGQLDVEQRDEHYQAAHAAFHQLRSTSAQDSVAGAHEYGPSVAALSDPAFANPLLVHMTALLHALPAPSGQPLADDATATATNGQASGLREMTLRGVLRRERYRWSRTAGYPDEPAASDAVTLVTLHGPLTEAETVHLLRSAPTLRDASLRDRGIVARWLHRLYPGSAEQWTVPLRPDLLAEQLLASNEHLAELTQAALSDLHIRDTTSVKYVARLLRTLATAGQREPVFRALRQSLPEYLPQLLELATNQAHSDLPAALSAAMNTGMALDLTDLFGAPLTLLPPYMPILNHGPFLGRSRELPRLQNWCKHGQASVDLLSVTGPGGFGKTTLAAELCVRMLSDGWDAGFISGSARLGRKAHRWDDSRPLLAVVDDADMQTVLLAQLVDRLMRRPATAPPIRLLVLARQLGTWWDEFVSRYGRS